MRIPHPQASHLPIPESPLTLTVWRDRHRATFCALLQLHGSLGLIPKGRFFFPTVLCFGPLLPLILRDSIDSRDGLPFVKGGDEVNRAEGEHKLSPLGCVRVDELDTDTSLCRRRG